MSRGVKFAVIAAIVIAALGIVGAGVLYLGGEPSYDESFRESCLTTARQGTDARGISGPDVQAAQRRMCDCALDLLKAMPEADRKALETSPEKRQAFSEDVQRHCL